ncbi:hypothetical protein BGZ61DRAFT_456511 [Ilyonectria robusta]|uniref:uncharacterized protein n=1 Tax=Ilyonectria robusta TaxID=1079257 RepID=UPI001E8DAA5A|nr:uncharacterized protein BGZ61DRAFT_456511 [Ilyonectria robusta]KAH8680288.1 hypothetical protein BGZ61DRAFT_456511 [Ilyonectria robusta]
MGYYGVVSKGCERCRRRKVKCDQRKPACLKCQKSKIQCPGYRDLDQVLFRNESERIIRKARQLDQPQPALGQEVIATSSHPPKNGLATACEAPPTSLPLGISYPPSQPVNNLGASFFFTKYTFNEVPFCGDYHDWLTQSYFNDGSVLQAAIEAVGMAGISNVSYAPYVASKAKEQYCKAVTAVNLALGDPVQAAADSTLMAVILLGLFETVNFETSDRYDYWAAHVKGATALLALRGQEQFTRKRGGLLYILIRSQIISACTQQHMPVPQALVQATRDFQTSIIRQQWQRSNVASRGSVCQISFRIVNLGAVFANGEITDLDVIRDMALEIDRDLEAWREGAPSGWAYARIDASEAAPGTFFDTHIHVYPSLWIAEAWNNWRALRIVVNKIIHQCEACSDAPRDARQSAPLSIIQELSTDMCISISSFMGTPRVLSLIRPLFVVALEELNTRSIRGFAVEQLRSIGESVGIRQAGLLATTISKTLDESPRNCVPLPNLFTIPLIPFF